MKYLNNVHWSLGSVNSNKKGYFKSRCLGKEKIPLTTGGEYVHLTGKKGRAVLMGQLGCFMFHWSFLAILSFLLEWEVFHLSMATWSLWSFTDIYRHSHFVFRCKITIFLAGCGKVLMVLRNFIKFLSRQAYPLDPPFLWHLKPFLPARPIRSKNNSSSITLSFGMVSGLWKASTRWHQPFIGGLRTIETSASSVALNIQVTHFLCCQIILPFVLIKIKVIHIFQLVNIYS